MSKKILHVTEEKDVRYVIIRMIAQDGFPYLIATDGKEDIDIGYIDSSGFLWLNPIEQHLADRLGLALDPDGYISIKKA